MDTALIGAPARKIRRSNRLQDDQKPIGFSGYFRGPTHRNKCPNPSSAMSEFATLCGTCVLFLSPSAWADRSNQEPPPNSFWCARARAAMLSNRKSYFGVPGGAFVAPH